MTPDEETRVALLKSRPACVPADFVWDYYGVRIEGELATFFGKWKSGVKGSGRCSAGVDRVLFELFCQQQRMLSYKWMGARLGMTEASVREILQKKQDVSLAVVYEYFDQLVLDSFKDDLLHAMQSIRFRTFGSHSDFCRRLHKAIDEELGIIVQPLMCATSEALHEEPVLYAHDFDCITLEPLSVKHSIWLNFGKPMSLPPDRSSKLFVARNQEALKSALAGMGTPENLELYEHAAQGA